MGSVSVTRIITASAERVWELVGTFSALQQWHPGIRKLRALADGSERFFEINGLGTAIERLSARDAERRTLTYYATDLPLPTAEYSASIAVEADGPDRCRVTWSSRFTAINFPEELLEKGVAQFFTDGLESLARIFADNPTT